MTRVLVGAVSHESNSFSPLLTTSGDFTLRQGRELWERPWRCDTLQGIVSELRAAGVEPVPALFARAQPGGLLTRDCFSHLCDSLLEQIDDGVDGACFYLHGAMRSVDEDFCDRELLRRLRGRLGPERPLAVAFDMHANLVPELADLLDIAVAFRTAPHIDEAETGARAARLLLRTLRGELHPVTAIVVAPWLLPGEQAETSRPPLREFMRTLAEAEHQQDLLAVSFTNGHPWADVSQINVAVTVVTEGDREQAHRVATELLEQVWRQRTAFGFAGEALEPAAAVRAALGSTEGPVIISDSGDNPDAGGTTRELSLLRELLQARPASALFCSLLAPGPEEICQAAAPGESVAISLEDPSGGEQLRLAGVVQRQGRLTAAESEGGGGCAATVLRCGGIDIVLTAERFSLLDPQQLHSLELDLAAYHIAVIKRGYLTPALQDAARRSLLALTPGASDCRLERLPYRRLQRPVWPLDVDAFRD